MDDAAEESVPDVGRRSETLRTRGSTRRYPRGAVLFREGQRSDSVVLLRSGSVKVSHVTRAGREVLLAVQGAGELLGELGAMDGAPRSATVTAIEDVEAVVVPAAAYREVVAADPDLAFRLLQLVIRRLRAADRMLIEHGAYDARRRVAIRLLELAEAFGQPTDHGVLLRFSQDDLAGWVGTSREAVNRALRVLRDEQLIATGRGTITVLDLDRLAHQTET